MSVIILLIVVSVLVAVFFVGIFIWAVKTGQYDDTYSPSVRMLFDNKKPAGQKDRQSKSNEEGDDKKDKKE
jgi:cbb3-type cytochrome oxidase maturation protein